LRELVLGRALGRGAAERRRDRERVVREGEHVDVALQEGRRIDRAAGVAERFEQAAHAALVEPRGADRGRERALEVALRLPGAAERVPRVADPGALLHGGRRALDGLGGATRRELGERVARGLPGGLGLLQDVVAPVPDLELDLLL